HHRCRVGKQTLVTPGVSVVVTTLDAPARLGLLIASTQLLLARLLICCSTKPGAGLTQLTITLLPVRFAANCGATGSSNAFTMEPIVPSLLTVPLPGRVVALTL